MAIVVEEFRVVRKNSLYGFALVYMTTTQMRVHDVATHESHGKRWAAPPSRPRLDSSGRQQTDENGKLVWQPIIVFDSREARDQWSNRVIAAPLKSFPDAFGLGAGEDAA